MGGFSQYTQPEESPRWRPFAIAAGMIVLVVAVIYVIGRSGGAATTTEKPGPVPYASNLQISDLHMSTAENFVGGRVIYIQGKISNLGDLTVTGAQVEIVFRNTLGEVVDRQTQPLRVEASPLGHPDWVPLSNAPLGPGNSAGVRLTFDHISADWNQGYPEIKFLSVHTK